jgi:hypothetical protein
MAKRPIPCRHKVMHAVYVSNLDASLRPVALAFAWFANNKGTHVWPCLATVASMVRADKRTVRRCVSRLRALGVLVLEDPHTGLHGGHGKSTRYRFQLDVLARLAVNPPVKRGHPRPGLSLAKGGHPRPGLPKRRRTPEVKKADMGGQEGGQMTHERRTPTSSDLSGSFRIFQEQTDADASADAPSEDTTPTNGIPFKVYAAIASDALHQSLREDQTDNFGEVVERFKRTCAQHDPPLPYDGELARKAVDAALHAKTKAAQAFHQQFKQIAQSRGMP